MQFLANAWWMLCRRDRIVTTWKYPQSVSETRSGVPNGNSWREVHDLNDLNEENGHGYIIANMIQERTQHGTNTFSTEDTDCFLRSFL